MAQASARHILVENETFCEELKNKVENENAKTGSRIIRVLLWQQFRPDLLRKHDLDPGFGSFFVFCLFPPFLPSPAFFENHSSKCT